MLDCTNKLDWPKSTLLSRDDVIGNSIVMVMSVVLGCTRKLDWPVLTSGADVIGSMVMSVVGWIKKLDSLKMASVVIGATTDVSKLNKGEELKGISTSVDVIGPPTDEGEG